MFNLPLLLIILSSFLALIVGIVLIIFRRRFSSKRKGIWITIIASMFCLHIVLTFPSPSELMAKQRLLFSTPSARVKTITIGPASTENRARPNLVDSIVTITGPGDIAAVMNALKNADSFSPNHPAAQWTCLVTITTQSESITVKIANVTDNKNGCLMYVYSHRTQGWQLGTFRCDELRPILERLAKSNAPAE